MQQFQIKPLDLILKIKDSINFLLFYFRFVGKHIAHAFAQQPIRAGIFVHFELIADSNWPVCECGCVCTKTKRNVTHLQKQFCREAFEVKQTQTQNTHTHTCRRKNKENGSQEII